jgi:hypothetical protein
MRVLHSPLEREGGECTVGVNFEMQGNKESTLQACTLHWKGNKESTLQACTLHWKGNKESALRHAIALTQSNGEGGCTDTKQWKST